MRHAHAMADAISGASLAEERGWAALPGSGPERFADLGSGGGVPALVLLERWPASEAVLIEAGARRSAFLRQSVEALGWQDRVQVLEERAEVSGQRPELRASFPLVTARSFARPGVTAECAAPLLGIDGLLVVSEPPEATARWPEAELAQLGLVALERRSRDGFHFQLLRQALPCAPRYPRRTGVPERRPLF